MNQNLGTLQPVSHPCALCNTVFQGTTLAGSNPLGTAPDLDTRQGGMGRTSIFLTVQHCKNCGYCSTDLKTAWKGAQKVVKSEDYQALLKDRKFHEVARHFRCAALIQEKSGELGAAGWMVLTAAWVCDDRKARDQAKELRKQVIDLWERGQRKKLRFARDPVQEGLLLVDLYRRIGEFRTSHLLAQEIHAGLGKLPSDQQKLPTAVLALQTHLCTLDDLGTYRMDDVIRYAQAPSTWKPKRWWEFWR